jgi:2-dehydro-3-deoxygluconokinase
VSGGEFNVAANLSDCFGMKAAIASAMVDYPVGDLIAERVRAMGVRPFYRRFEHDGVTGPNLATVYSDRGFGVRPPVVFYNRANEAAALLKPGDFDWKAIFADGVRWFHSGGIFASLSASAVELIIEAMQAARSAGAVVSFDLNYREKLWAASGGKQNAARVFSRILEHVDVAIGSPEDLEGGSAKLMATTLRQVHSSNRHTWSAAAWVDGRKHEAPSCELDVYDRVGSGDGFAAGLIYGLLSGESIDEALKLGWAHGALVSTFPGDTTMATLEEVRALAHGASARIQR